MLPPPMNATFTLLSFRARRRLPCRCAPSSSPRRPPPPGRPTCPSTACRNAGVRAAGVEQTLHRLQWLRLARRVGSGSGIAIRPRSASRGSPATARPAPRRRRRHAALAGFAADVDLQQHVERRQSRPAAARTGAARSSGGRPTAPSRSARRSSRVLLLWIGPMKCHAGQAGAQAPAHARSCRGLPARSSRRSRAARRQATAITASAGKVLLTATRAIALRRASGGSRSLGNALVNRPQIGLHGLLQTGHNRLQSR